jgi:hypothetical protein
MNRRKKILAGISALIVGLSLAMPLRASADDRDHDNDHHQHAWSWDRDHDNDHHHAWRWERDEDHYRAYPGYDRDDRPGYAYGNRPRYLPPNGQGMINQRNPNLYWACDSEGHHCQWTPRR